MLENFRLYGIRSYEVLRLHPPYLSTCIQHGDMHARSSMEILILQ